MTRTRARLNRDLSPQDFRARVSVNHDLVLVDSPGECGSVERLRAYLRDLGWPDEPDAKGFADLTGRYAIEHARRVQAKIQRHFLRFPNVSAVDVGFAVRNGKFQSSLAIRIHVGAKRPGFFLRQEGMQDFTSILHFLRAVYSPQERSTYAEGVGSGDLGLDDAARETAIRDDAKKVKAKREKAANAPKDHCPECHRKCKCRCAECKGCCACCGCDRGDQTCACCREDAHLSLCGVPLDIIQAQYFPSGSHPGGDFGEGVYVDRLKPSGKIKDRELLLTGRGKVSPLVGGVSVGGPSGVAGTLATIVWDETDGSPCILGNWHVLANGTRAERGQPCYQPALFDGGCTGDEVAHLKRWHFGEKGDAAIAELDGGRDFATGEILGMWHPIAGYQEPELNLVVRKWGRSTGFTEGFIDGLYLATNIDFGGGFVRHFENQFHLAPLYPGEDVSQSGDSGALILTKHDIDDLELVTRALLRQESKVQSTIQGLLQAERHRDVEALAAAVRQALRRCGVPDARPADDPPMDSRKSDIAERLFAAKLAAAADAKTAAGKTAAKRATKPERGAATEDSETSPAAGLAGAVPADGDAGASESIADFLELLSTLLEEHGVSLVKSLRDKLDQRNRQARNVYYAVGMIFAGDTPGSPFGEFALASPLEPLARELRFSLRPVFESRSSFRALRSEPAAHRTRGHAPWHRVSRQPGELGPDPRGGGPQPDGASYQSGGGNSGGNP